MNILNASITFKLKLIICCFIPMLQRTHSIRDTSGLAYGARYMMA
jgi:hypothetical protein